MTDTDYIYKYFAPDNSIRISTTPPVYKREWGYDVDTRKLSEPKKGDLVEYMDQIGWIRYINTELEVVAVGFPNNESDEFDLSSFRGNYTSDGRRHKWAIG